MTSVLISVMESLWSFSLDLIPLLFKLLGIGLLLLVIAALLAPFATPRRDDSVSSWMTR